MTAVAVTGLTVAHSSASGKPRSGTAARANPYLNGTFERDTSGWFTRNGATLARVRPGHGGAFAARLTQQRAGGATVTLNDSRNSVANTVAGRTYTVSAWVRAQRPASPSTSG